MSGVEIRPFQRSDREQLTGLVNAHVAAVVPGIVVSVNAVMSQLEREPERRLLIPGWSSAKRSSLFNAMRSLPPRISTGSRTTATSATTIGTPLRSTGSWPATKPMTRAMLSWLPVSS